MEVLEAILTRRSIRDYRPGAIAEEDIQQLLKAAMYAPSAHNYQPWHFVVIKEKILLQKIRKLHPYADMLKKASLAIIVCGDLKLERHIGYLVQDCAAATQNILLAAHGLGLGAVWLGIYPRVNRIKAITKLIGLPKGIMPLTMVSVGNPAEEKIIKDRFKTERVHINRWRPEEKR